MKTALISAVVLMAVSSSALADVMIDVRNDTSEDCS